MYKKIGEYEALTKEYNGESDRLDAELRDTGKKVQKFETRMEETMEKLQEHEMLDFNYFYIEKKMIAKNTGCKVPCKYKVWIKKICLEKEVLKP